MNCLNDLRRPLGHIALGIFLLAAALPPLHAQQHNLSSPNGQLQVTVETSPDLRWHLHYRNQPLLLPAEIGLELDRIGALGRNVQVVRTAQSTINRVERPAVAQKSAEIPERYNELTVFCQGEWGVVFRAFDEGVAYRFFTRFNGPSTVLDERFSLQPAGCKTVYFPEEENFYSHNERLYKPLTPSEIPAGRLASLPVLLQYNNGVHLLLTETDLQDYPGLWVRGSASPGGLTGDFPHRVQYTVQVSDRDREPIDRDRAMAVTDGLRTYPWRLFLVAGRPADLLVNQMPWLLAEPSRLKETAWIRPGKVAWDWWNNLNVTGVDFRAGVNTATYRHFVDFAAENGLEYIILDEGWSEPADLLKVNPALDMDALADYARQKKVGLILWTTWIAADRQFDALLPQLKKWDIKGLKIDFMQRDDQDVVNFYWRMAEKCANNRLLVDFHGAHKPAGLQRTWPNVLTFEGVYGLEQAKWDPEKRVDPEHDVLLPFTRQVAGPMDYTPGAMLNRQKDDWAPSFNRPASLGTRCHELAKYVVFESPLQMLADNPSNYRKEPESLKFLSQVPAVWARTEALDGLPGDYVALARQAFDGRWYVGAMTDWTARELNLPTAFLPAGTYELEVFSDGLNADRNAEDYRRSVTRFQAGQPLPVKMAKGGGYVAVLRRL